MRIDTHGQAVTDEELAVVAAAALAASEGWNTSVAPERLDDAAMAALAAVLAAADMTLRNPELPLPVVNTAWRRPSFEQSVRPRWR